MKHCPSCQTNYADDTLQFCLQDGTQLRSLPPTDAPTVAFNDAEAQTVVRNPPPDRINFDLHDSAQSRQSRSGQTSGAAPSFAPPQQQAPKSNTALVVLLTALVMLLLFGAGLGAWLFLGNRKTAGNRETPTPTKTPVNVSANTNANANTNSNINANSSPTASPTASATPTATPDFDPDEIKSEVSSKMNAWRDSMESGDINSVMSHYADRLDYYYRGRNLSSSFVRANKKKAFDRYDSFEVNISDLRVTPDASGEKATVVFNKSWVFEGADDRNEGSVRAQFELTKIGGKWYITGEKDL
jgi:hypothetical protein